MYIPKSLITIVVLVCALAIGWLSHDVLGQLALGLTGGSLASSEVAQVSASADPAGPAAPPAIYLTIVNSPAGTTATVPTGAPVRATVPAPSRAATGATVRGPAATNWRMPAQRASGAGPVPRTAAAPLPGTHAQAVGGGLIVNLTPQMGATAIGEEPDDKSPPGSLVVGGDGIDDLSLRVDGVGNVSTYDDSNVVIGGSGAVNAQIGDSDTGGTVTMDTVDSTVSGGNSR